MKKAISRRSYIDELANMKQQSEKKKLNAKEIAVCKFQAEVFESSAKICKCSSAIFVRRFMNSQVAKRLDAGAYDYEPMSVVSVIAEIESEYGNSTYGSNVYSPNELHWIGYIYRYWCILYGKSSSRVYKIANASEMDRLYMALHTLDPGMAISQIMEEAGIPDERDMVQKGVRILREIRKAKKRT